MSQHQFREGNVVLYIKERINKYQTRIMLENNKWKWVLTGESNLKNPSLIACEKYDELRFKIKNKIVLDTRIFKNMSQLAISEMKKRTRVWIWQEKFSQLYSSTQKILHSLF